MISAKPFGVGPDGSVWKKSNPPYGFTQCPIPQQSAPSPYPPFIAAQNKQCPQSPAQYKLQVGVCIRTGGDVKICTPTQAAVLSKKLQKKAAQQRIASLTPSPSSSPSANIPTVQSAIQKTITKELDTTKAHISTVQTTLSKQFTSAIKTISSRLAKIENEITTLAQPNAVTESQQLESTTSGSTVGGGRTRRRKLNKRRRRRTYRA
jgi:hypothetical protein